MAIVDVVDKVKRFERAAAAPHFSWFAPAGALLIGAGVGAWIAGKSIHSPGVLVTLIAGVLFVAFGRLFGWSRSENLEAICDDFGEYLQRWPDVMGPPPMSAEYERLVIERRTRGALQGLKRIWWVVTR